METLIINIPEEKSNLVKSLLTELGVTFQNEKKQSIDDFKKALLNISVWTEEELETMESARKSFDSFKPVEW